MGPKSWMETWNGDLCGEDQADARGCLLFDNAVIASSSLLDSAFSTVGLLEFSTTVADGVLETGVPVVGKQQELGALLDHADLVGCVGDVDRVMALPQVLLGDAFWKWVLVGRDQAPVPDVRTLILAEFETESLTCLFETGQVVDLDLNFADVRHGHLLIEQ